MARLVVPEDRPSVVLLHDDLPSPRPAGQRDFSYYAMGHLHRGRVHARKGRGVMAYPGHLFSYWDGDGKAWPTTVVEGVIEQDGKVSATLRGTSALTGAPETRRLFVDFQDAGQPAGTLVFENAPSAAFFAAAGLSAVLDEDGPRGAIPRTVARIRYESGPELRRALRLICEGCPDDVFVTPSTGGGWRDRLADRGRSIIARRLDELAAKVYKRSANTQ